MCIALQTLISYLGPAVTNTSGHSYCTRFLYTVVPSEMYATDTLDTLLYALSEDLENLYKEGLEVACHILGIQCNMSCI
ncbi:unnamed protein product [Symbiodinium sp. CCMP2592]|nr:unnamed protein product [Symbiodinium sp. CCMP2592]